MDQILISTPTLAVVTVALVSFGLAVTMVPVVRRLARGRGLYEQPVEDRWHRRPVPKLGGVAMAVAFLPVAWLVADSPGLRALVLSTAVACGVGLFDDLRPVRPIAKLLWQTAAGVVFLALAPPVQVTGLTVVDTSLALFWFVGITNAFNLLDNIDGLAAGIAGIAATFFVAALLLAGVSPLESLPVVMAALAATAFGFLVHNWHPASIFMGDSGSHLLGAGLAGGTLLAASQMATGTQPGAAMAVILLLVPCADTLLVILTRQLRGQSPFVGGRDHLSHRIVALGMREPRAVLVLYGLAVLGGLAALGLWTLSATLGWALVAAYGALVASVGVYLGHIEVAGTGARPVEPLLPRELTLRYRAYELLFDSTLVTLAYYLGLVTRFHDPESLSLFLAYFGRVLPLVLALHLTGLWLAGKYRRPQHAGWLAEALVIVKGVAIGSTGTIIAVLYTTGFLGYSRQAFAVAAAFAVVLVAGGHFGLRALDEYLRHRRRPGPMAIIYGAGPRGALTVRELSNNPSLGLTPWGFIDDDPSKSQDRPGGLRVLGSLDDLDALLSSRTPGPITTVIVSVRSLGTDRFERLCAVCDEHRVDVRQLRFSLDGIEGRRGRGPAVVRFRRD